MKELNETSINQIPIHSNNLSQSMLPAVICGSRIIRIKELSALIGLSRSTIYDRLNPKSQRFDPTFPKPIKLGASAIGWHSAAVQQWINSLCSTP